MHALVWSDYLCPWCYLGRQRSEVLRSLGVTVEAMTYELHPGLGDEPHPVRPGGRLATVFARVAALCGDAGLTFRAPETVASSRRALQAAEVVRSEAPDQRPALDDALFTGVFVEGLDLSDRDAVAARVSSVGLDGPAIIDEVEAGAGREALADSMARAHEVGVGAVPAWWVDERLLIPGAVDEATLSRWVTKLDARQR